MKQKQNYTNYSTVYAGLYTLLSLRFGTAPIFAHSLSLFP